jgi:hypothetical protein
MPHALTALSSTVISSIIVLAAIAAGAPINNSAWSQTLKPFYALSASFPKPQHRRIISARRSDTPEGSRFTLTSDSPLDDYSSYVEGERFFVNIPQATLIGERKELNGHGFADMRIEQSDKDVLLSFRLRQGATVNISRSFNRLDILFLTNERTNKPSANPEGEVLQIFLTLSPTRTTPG